ncbi:RagB/SusD family nutrient uptake outer membrane protein [Puteibacter caeruleilacunae]|nr:RagB/SusD family nutrient uptake outer membrane protein [Puteibacter caeruleilacunae]
MKHIYKITLALIVLVGFTRCDYLDVVPDNVATVDYAFRDRIGVEKYLFTCYNYLPKHSDAYSNPAIMGGDEIWMYYPVTVYYGNTTTLKLARGFQNVNDPLVNYWDGRQSGRSMFQAVRDCNIFLERVFEAGDLDPYERDRMISEVKVLKAYFLFWMMRMYGPIPIMKENLPVTSTSEEVRIEQQSISEVVTYAVSLIDEAIENLPSRIQDKASELGRLTKPAALSIKAKILLTAASPLFNGNRDFSSYPGFKAKDESLWGQAAEACKQAIDACEEAGHRLYTFTDFKPITDSTRVKMSIRNSVCDKWNDELIWGNSGGGIAAFIQNMAHPHLDPTTVKNQVIKTFLAPPLRMAEQFYTQHGVPISEDKTWDYDNRYQLRTAQTDDRYYIKEGYKTAALHFDREPRFYANLGFDGGRWYGQGKLSDEEAWTFKNKKGQTGARVSAGLYTVTGYTVKKLVHYENTVTENSYNRNNYPFPIIRLADVYLMYAEALNEANGPSDEVYTYLDKVRERAGLNGVVESWDQYSNNPEKAKSQEGLREIIHQERLIEMAFEGQRFWDVRRWEEAEDLMNEPIQGWDITGETPEDYYSVRTLFVPEFTRKEYFWPIKETNLIVNSKLKQNPGW